MGCGQVVAQLSVGTEDWEMDLLLAVHDQAASKPCPAWSDQPISANWRLPDLVSVIFHAYP